MGKNPSVCKHTLLVGCGEANTRLLLVGVCVWSFEGPLGGSWTGSLQMTNATTL